MRPGTKELFFSLILVFTFCFSYGQEEWNVPWIVIGDSLDLVEGEKIVVTGRITNKITKEPIPGASISVDGYKYFDYSDKTGAYAVELLPGHYRIRVKQLGMFTVYIRAHVVSQANFNIEMEEGTVQLNEIIITARPIDSNVKASLTGLTKMNIVEVKTLPTLMGEVDIIKSLQLMPGVTSVGEGASGFNVRGGRVDQNLVLFNDAPLFYTSHALGFISAFNQDIIRDFSLYKGNVPANFGGRASSVLEINTRRGDFEKWNVNGGIGPVTSRLGVEGPIIKNKTSILATGRISHIGWALKKAKNPDVQQSKTAFSDFFAGITHRFSENSSLEVGYYSSNDDFQFSDQFGFAWNTSVASAKWQALANRKASPVVSLSYGNYQNDLIDPSGTDASILTNGMNYFQFKPYVNITPSDRHNIVAGASSLVYLPTLEKFSGYNGNQAVENKQVTKDKGIEMSVYANDEFDIAENFSVTFGLRYSLYYQLGKDQVYQYASGQPRVVASITDTVSYEENERIVSYGGFEPRVSARINVTPAQSIKFGYNRMLQYIHLISNTTAPTPIDLWQVSNRFLKPQVSDNFSLGYFFNLKDNRWETSAEAFYKTMDNIVEYKDFPELYTNDHLETELLSGIGQAWGGELYARKLKGRWTGWVSYTYSQTLVKVNSPIASEQINNGKWFYSNYNKPHNFNLVVNRVMKNNSAFSAIFTYTSGRPFTAIESSYVVSSTVVPIYSERNKYSIPNYIRLDLSLTFGNVFRKIDDSLVLSFYNFLGRDNAYSVFYKRPAPNFKIPKPYQLSVLGAMLPSIVYNFKF